MRQEELVKRFSNCAVTGHASNMYIDGDILYSYGAHCPLLVRKRSLYYGDVLIMNADKYSVTTSQHQALCWRVADIMVSFGTLALAGITVNLFDELEVLDYTQEIWERRWVLKYDYRNGDDPKAISDKCYRDLRQEEREKYRSIEERRPAYSLLLFRKKYYLSGMDGRNFFISQLPRSAHDVNEALEIIKPKAFKNYKGAYKRQGEWFFVRIKVSSEVAKRTYELMPSNVTIGLTERSLCPLCHGKRGGCKYCGYTGKVLVASTNTNPHIATRGCRYVNPIRKVLEIPENTPKVTQNTWIVSGQIRHPEHGMLKLSTLASGIKLYTAYRNSAVESYSSGAVTGLRID